MIAKPMRKLSTGLSSLGILMSVALLGAGVSDDIADVAEVVTLVELIQLLREQVQVGRSKMQAFLYHHPLTENPKFQFRTNFMT